MRYDLGNALERTAFKQRVNKLYEKGAIVQLAEVKAKRSLPQNAILHLWIAVIANTIGEYDREQVKSDIKSILLGKQTTYNCFTGEEEQREYRTSQMTKEQMQDFLTRLQHWALNELGVTLPSPEDRGFAEMQERYP